MLHPLRCHVQRPRGALLISTPLGVGCFALWFYNYREHSKVTYNISRDQILLERDGKVIKSYDMHDFKAAGNSKCAVTIDFNSFWRASLLIHPESRADEIVRLLNEIAHTSEDEHTEKI